LKTWLSWSGGKDSAWALYQLTQNPDIELSGLVVTINQQQHRVAMHGTHENLLQQQVNRLNIPLYPVYIPEPCDNETYQKIMNELINQAKLEQVQQMAFGDLFLEDVRAYREKQLLNTGIEPVFPLWKKSSTIELANEIIDAGVKAIITCVDTKQLPAEFVGRQFDRRLLADLPKKADPCGENGEFHTFVYDAPMFATPINVNATETHQAGQFLFVNLEL
jgi:uncharacterized protein (TIGR00290 family)